jgi:rhomboid family protein
MSNQYYQTQQRFSFTPRERITWSVQRLILLNVIIFAGQLLLDMIPLLGSSGAPGGLPVALLSFSPAQFRAGFLWQPLTYMFFHGGLLHLFGNMLWLFFFGPEVERTLGTRQFLRFYVICGAVAVLATLVPHALGGRDTSVLGASGATMAVLVAYAMANPDRQVHLFPLPIPLSVRALVIIIVVMNLFTALGDSAVSWETHFGGLAAGFAYMWAVPRLRRQWDQWHKPPPAQGEERDPVQEAVDNIFKFDEEKKRRK